MSKIKEVSKYDGSSWGTAIPLGANDANIDITASTTNPTDDTTSTSAGLIDSNVTVSSGDTDASAWTKFNRFRKRVQNAFGNFAGVTLASAYSTVNTGSSVYTTGVINNYMSNVIGYTGTTAPSAGTVASQLSSLNDNLSNKLPNIAAADLNSLLVGNPVVTAYDSTSTLNVPTSDRHGYCIHYASSANYAVQMAQSVGEHNIYIRKKSGGTWDTWTHIDDKIIFAVTGQTLANKTNTIFCTTEADTRVGSSTNVAHVIFLDPNVLASQTYTVITNSNGTITLSGITTSATPTTVIIACYN